MGNIVNKAVMNYVIFLLKKSSYYILLKDSDDSEESECEEINPIDVKIEVLDEGCKLTSVTLSGNVINLNTRNLRINDIPADRYFNDLRNNNLKGNYSAPNLTSLDKKEVKEMV